MLTLRIIFDSLGLSESKLPPHSRLQFGFEIYKSVFLNIRLKENVLTENIYIISIVYYLLTFWETTFLKGLQIDTNNIQIG